MPEVTVTKSDGYELVYETTVIITNTIFSVMYDGLPLDVVFKSDDGETRYQSRVAGPRVVLELFNFKNALGEGMLTPIPFALTGDRSIVLSFLVRTVNVELSHRVITLNFFLGPIKSD